MKTDWRAFVIDALAAAIVSWAVLLIWIALGFNAALLFAFFAIIFYLQRIRTGM